MNRIKMLREKYGMTQQELADKLDGAKSTVAMYEKGDRKPSLEILIKLSEIFNCSMDYLMGRTDYKNDIDYLNKNNDLISETFTLEKEITKDLPSLNINDILIPMQELRYQQLDAIHYLEEKLKDIPLQYREKVKKIILFYYNLIINSPENSINFEPKNSIEYIPVIGKIAAGQPILAEEYRQGVLPVVPDIYGLTTSEKLFYLLVSGDSMDRKVEDGDYVLIHKQDYAQDGDIIVAIVNDDNEATLKRYKVISNQYIQLEPMSTNPVHQTRTIDLKTTKFLIIGKAIGKFGKF